MNLLTIAFISAVILTLLSIVMILAIIGLRLFTDRRLDHDAEFRKRGLLVLKAFLADKASIEVASTILRKNSDGALALMTEISEKLDQTAQKKLNILIATLPLEKRALSELTSKRWEKRLHAAERLGYIAEDSALPQLMMALRDPAISVRYAAARSLVRLGCHDAVVPIIQSLDLPGEISQRRIIEILIGLREASIEPILGILKNPSSPHSFLSIASRLAGMLKNGRCLPYLQKLLRHEDPNVRLNSVRALASIGDHISIEPISKLGEDPSWEVRNSVMHALGKLGAQDQIPVLLQGLSDQEWWVRYNAAQALYHLGDEGIKALQNSVEHHVDGYGREMSAQILQKHGIWDVSMGAHS